MALGGCAATPPPPQALAPNTVNDITALNPIAVADIVAPTTIEEISHAVTTHDGPVSIGGGRFSQGGQTACTGCLFIDMRAFNRVLAIDKTHHRITVQAGITWRQMQAAIDPLDLSPKVMQSYSNFTVGGSLSVNCHGRYVGEGPIIGTVEQIRLVMADGSIKTASRTENPDLFAAAIGGYGGIGVIAEVTLDLADNVALKRVHKRMPVSSYRSWYEANIAHSTTAVMSSATLYPGAYNDLNVITSSRTDRPVTIPARLAPLGRPGELQLAMLDFVTHNPLGKLFREQVYDRLHRGDTEVVWRNFEDAEDAYGLEPKSRATLTYVLQEYFVPENRFDDFVPKMAAVLNRHHVNVLNVSVRHAKADGLTLMSWARHDVFAFVLYYEQGTDDASKAEVTTWTRELIDAAIAEDGAYYLPYQIQATREQFLKAYPHAEDFFALKRRVDPTYKFRNRLWEAYYRP